jgi:hypothetical protein
MINIGFKIINLDCVIGFRDLTIQLPPSILDKFIILKPIVSKYQYSGHYGIGILITYLSRGRWQTLSAANLIHRP